MKNLMEQPRSMEQPKSMENELDEKTLNQIKEDLLNRKKEIQKTLEDLTQKDYHETDSSTAKFPEYGYKADENAQEVSDYSVDIGKERVLKKSLENIKGALERIERGEYGICTYCKGNIDRERLKIIPMASSCFSCKDALQKND